VVVPTKQYSGAVLLVTDVFGYKTDSIRRWADKLANAVSRGKPWKAVMQVKQAMNMAPQASNHDQPMRSESNHQSELD
jgi:hypothetical protein